MKNRFNMACICAFVLAGCTDSAYTELENNRKLREDLIRSANGRVSLLSVPTKYITQVFEYLPAPGQRFH